MMLILFVLIAGAIAYASGWRPQFLTKLFENSQSTEAILKARYARGEITRAEYDQILRDLEG